MTPSQDSHLLQLDFHLLHVCLLFWDSTSAEWPQLQTNMTLVSTSPFRAELCLQVCHGRISCVSQELGAGRSRRVEILSFAGLLKRLSHFAHPLETCGFFNTKIKEIPFFASIGLMLLFPPKTKGHHHLQVAMFRCIHCKDPCFVWSKDPKFGGWGPGAGPHPGCFSALWE